MTREEYRKKHRKLSDAIELAMENLKLTKLELNKATLAFNSIYAKMYKLEMAYKDQINQTKRRK